ncbi:uncharacterized protein JCM10292_005272 [Rhodotorula paludigena]|uniref:uncharacterized protein n=1 Tax=Rhodotorula paludigena TaxID=86838 RepID=UPI003177F7AE
MPPSPTKAPAASGRKVVGQPYELEGDGLRKADHHYREARTQILRTLGKSAHRNGSQFAILWVTPDGRSEAFASEALQDRLQNWLGKDAQAEARELVRRHRAERDQRRRAGLEVLAGDKVFGTAGEIVAHTETTKGLFLSDGDAMDLGDSEEGALSGRVPILIDPSTLLSPDALPLPPPPAPFGNDDSLPAPSAVGGASPVLGNDFSPPAFSHGLPGTATSSRFNGSAHELGPSPRLSAASAPSPAGSSSSPFLAPSAVAPVPPVTSPVPSRLIRRTFTPDELVDWYSERFGDLWHKVDKLVCKAWIKTVEPQKQTKFQYQRGDKTKPGWWPESVRHKEPDHLAKPERITLLVHLLRNGPASIEELQLATGAVSAHIPHEKMRILREIYDIAKQEKEVVERSNGASSPSIVWATLKSSH